MALLNFLKHMVNICCRERVMSGCTQNSQFLAVVTGGIFCRADRNTCRTHSATVSFCCFAVR